MRTFGNILNTEICCEDFPNICRICLTKKFDLKFINHLDISDLFHILKRIININIDDNLPKKICDECTCKLKYTCSFITLCEENERNLKNVLHQEKHSNRNFDTKLLNFHEQNLKSNDNKEYLSQSNNNWDNVNNTSNQKLIIVKPMDHEIHKNPCANSDKCEHNTEYVPVRQHKCAVCNKLFSTKFKLTLHIRSHTKETPFECNICLKKFRFASNLNRHIDIIHKRLIPFKCDICEKGFTRNANLIEHKADHSGERPFICSYCGLSFNKKRRYTCHLQLHKDDTTNLICNICSKIFTTPASLKKHKVVHTRQNNFLCDICGKRFKTKQILSNHINIHLCVKLFKCKFCDKSFSRKSTLDVHYLSHTKQKPFKCASCLKTFAQLVHLKNHERTHSGDKPYQCTFCGSKFSVKCNLVIHMRIHTKDTKYKCTVCDKIYYESRSLKKHMKIHQDSSLIVLTNEDISTLLS